MRAADRDVQEGKSYKNNKGPKIWDNRVLSLRWWFWDLSTAISQ